MKLVLTCEHGGHEIPKPWKPLFRGADDLLTSHRGYDPGALDLFHHLEPLADFSRSATVSRLLIELNRSLHHPKLFSGQTRFLQPKEKQRIIEEYYAPYRSEVESKIRKYITAGSQVLHLSVHSFTPELDGKRRTADVGLLYDPARIGEKKICHEMAGKLKSSNPDLRIRMNYPYKGVADGFTTYLRKCFPEGYRGIELEINQHFVRNNRMDAKLAGQFFEMISNLSDRK